MFLIGTTCCAHASRLTIGSTRTSSPCSTTGLHCSHKWEPPLKRGDSRSPILKREHNTGDTMRYMVMLAALLATSCLGLQSVQANTIKYSTVGAWTIAVDPTMGNGCFLITNFVGGASIRIGFDMRNSTAIDVYTILGSVKWRSIEYGKNYPIRIRFGNQPAWAGNATGFSFNPPQNQTWLRMAIIRKTGFDFVSDFMKERFVAVDYNRREILRLNLKDSYAAGLKLIECQKAASKVKQDPFRETTSPTVEDPFR